MLCHILDMLLFTNTERLARPFFLGMRLAVKADNRGEDSGPLSGSNGGPTRTVSMSAVIFKQKEEELFVSAAEK